MNHSLLSLRNVRLDLPRRQGIDFRPILKGVELEVAESEVVALVGESGSGKSMTARSIVRLLPNGARLSGEITYRDESVLAMRGPRLRAFRASDVAMIFQDPRAHINPTRTVGDFLTETLLLRQKQSRKDARELARGLLEDVRITNAEGRLDQYPHQLSGGMLQRVMIASALASNPSLILADEPTTALDVSIQAGIVRMLGELQRDRSLAMIFITHDLELAQVVASRAAVMYAGRVVETSPTFELVNAALHPYTIGLLRSRPSPSQQGNRLLALAGRPLSADEAPPGCSFAERCPLAIPDCRAAEPALRMVDGHPVACLRAEESRSLLLIERGRTLPLRPRISSGRLRPSPENRLIEAIDLSRVFRSNGPFSRRRESVLAVDRVSFAVNRGESLAIVGESGSGKTTIGRILVGLDRPTSGIIRIDGRERSGHRVAGLSRKDSAKLVQIVFQNPYLSLDPRQKIGQSIREVVRFAAGLANDELDGRVEDLLFRVGLDPSLGDRYPRSLSGGQRQRVAIARALATEPAALVLDEAVASLDASIQAQILNLLADLRDDLGISYVFITHDLNTVRLVADRILVMRAGGVVEAGPADQVLESPREDYTSRLIASTPSRLLRARATGSIVGV
jgi:peptide/nickel transport system ATP-binding protein